MRSLFFMDPLAAAWWSKHFGMRFGEWYHGEYDAADMPTEWQDRKVVADAIQTHLDGYNTGEWRIHPDDAQILKGVGREKKNALKLLGMWPEGEADALQVIDRVRDAMVSKFNHAKSDRAIGVAALEELGAALTDENIALAERIVRRNVGRPDFVRMAEEVRAALAGEGL